MSDYTFKVSYLNESSACRQLRSMHNDLYRYCKIEYLQACVEQKLSKHQHSASHR